MPKATLEKRHFGLLRKIVDHEIIRLQLSGTLEEEDLAYFDEVVELKKLLSYTEYLKRFTVEIKEDAECQGCDNSEPSPHPPSRSNG